MKTCSIDGCAAKHEARGWCNKHYLKWKNHGDPLGGESRYSNPEEAFASRTQRDGDCIAWTGSKDPKGYGQIRVGQKIERAHRYAWARVNGPIPEGMVIDHACFRTDCVNPEHLRLATVGENNSHCSGPRSTNLTGLRNVSRHGNAFIVRIVSGGEVHYLGRYPTEAEAASAASAARRTIFGEFAGRGYRPGKLAIIAEETT